MSQPTVITHVTNEDGDYEAIYVNDLLHTEQTKIPLHVLQYLAEQFQPFTAVNLEVTAEWIENEGGTYPRKLSEIPQSAFTL
jgi:hypothetical protein